MIHNGEQYYRLIGQHLKLIDTGVPILRQVFKYDPSNSRVQLDLINRIQAELDSLRDLIVTNEQNKK